MGGYGGVVFYGVRLNHFSINEHEDLYNEHCDGESFRFFIPYCGCLKDETFIIITKSFKTSEPKRRNGVLIKDEYSLDEIHKFCKENELKIEEEGWFLAEDEIY